MVRVVVVDDELMILKAFFRLCGPIENVSVVGTFQDPAEALEFFDDQAVDVAFLDVGMPIINGLELAELLFQIQPDIRIVFLVTDEEEFVEIFEEKNCQFLIKPFKTSEIEAVLHCGGTRCN